MAVKEDVGMQIKMNVKCFKEIIDLEEGKPIQEKGLHDLIDFVNARYDCADFRMLVLIKTYRDYRHLLSSETVDLLKQAILGFKYWMDEPGEDGMCFWSENHQIIFHTCEYLAGQIFLEDTFQNDQTKGKDHLEKARIKIRHWLKDRFTYGFIEWHSNTYYEEDIAPLVLLVEQAKDKDIVIHAKMILDLLFLDMAQHTFQGYFVATSGRCYENQKKSGQNADVNDILKKAFGILKHPYNYERLSTLFLLTKAYQVPEVIKHVARLEEKGIIKESMGLDLKEVRYEIDEKTKDRQGMYFWGMEAFTNPESIDMTMMMYNDWSLQDNNFLRDLNMINKPILRKLKLLPLLVRILNPATQGVAIERVNSYTFHTKHFMLSTAQAYHPKAFGDQHHIWQATLPNDVNIFSTHPGSPMFDDPARNFSPSYWVGNGINPLAVQHENRVFLMYRLTPRKGFLERKRQYLVHFFIPFDRCDEVFQEDRNIFIRVQDTYCALQFSTTYQTTDDDVILSGKHIQAVVTMGSKEQHESFENFKGMIEQEELLLTRYMIFLESRTTTYRMNFQEKLIVNKKTVNLVYPRFDTPYIQAERKPGMVEVVLDQHRLVLDFDGIEREVS
jgi:hypothetical protein